MESQIIDYNGIKRESSIKNATSKYLLVQVSIPALYLFVIENHAYISHKYFLDYAEIEEQLIGEILETIMGGTSEIINKIDNNGYVLKLKNK